MKKKNNKVTIQDSAPTGGAGEVKAEGKTVKGFDSPSATTVRPPSADTASKDTAEALQRYRRALDAMWGESQEVRDAIVKHFGTLHSTAALQDNPGAKVSPQESPGMRSGEGFGSPSLPTQTAREAELEAQVKSLCESFDEMQKLAHESFANGLREGAAQTPAVNQDWRAVATKLADDWQRQDVSENGWHRGLLIDMITGALQFAAATRPDTAKGDKS